jgi:hypothetical protein
MVYLGLHNKPQAAGQLQHLLMGGGGGGGGEEEEEEEEV